MNNQYMPDAANILYGSYIRYDTLYGMTNYAFYGKCYADSVNIFIDIYSLLKSLYRQGDNLLIKDSYVIASCMINLAIHLRAYFETRHRVSSKIYLIYGGARNETLQELCSGYNQKNIIMEDSNQYLYGLVKDNMDVMGILCPYLYDIFFICDYKNEFSVIASYIIDIHNGYHEGMTDEELRKLPPNIIYSKEQLAYQLVASKPHTFLYRPKKKANNDASFVVTKSILYDSYRFGELDLKTSLDCKLPDVRLFSLLQTISGVKSRNIKGCKQTNSAIKLISECVERGIFANGYRYNSIIGNSQTDSALYKIIAECRLPPNLMNIFLAVDLDYNLSVYRSYAKTLELSFVNLYDPQEVRNINDKYFQLYPLDLNRV